MRASNRLRTRLEIYCVFNLMFQPLHISSSFFIICVNRAQCFFFVAVFFGCISTDWVGLCFLWVYVQELPKAQPAMVLVLKCLRRWGNSLKSHPTNWEKCGIKPATPGLQDKNFFGSFLGINQFHRIGLR